MKVLYLSAWFPYPPNNGARIRTYNLIKALSEQHEVLLISFLQEDSDPQDSIYLYPFCEVLSLHELKSFQPNSAKAMAGYLSRTPRSFIDTFDPEVKKSVRNAVKTYLPDVIVASTIGMAPYVPHDLRVYSVLDEHNCEHCVLKRHAQYIYSRLSKLRHEIGWRKYARWEAKTCRKFDAIVTVSDEDRRQLIKSSSGLNKVVTVPNGVDINHYTPAFREPEGSSLVYTGALTYGANLDAARYFAAEIYPVLVRKIPDVSLKITGRTDGVDLRGIEDCPGVELTGYVDDIRSVLNKCAICVVPLREGGGSRLKILEAMAAGIPVISTSIGAEGIDAVNGKHILIVDNPHDFAVATAQLLTDINLSQSLSHNARSLVEECYSWNGIGKVFNKVLESFEDS